MAGLLTDSSPVAPSRYKQWLYVTCSGSKEITAAGTVTDFHDIPF